MSSDSGGLSRLRVALSQVPPSQRPALIARAIGTRARRALLGALYTTGAYRSLPRRFAGKGVVLLFHEVHEDVGRELMFGCQLEHLLNAVRFCREDGRDIVDLDEAARRLQDPGAKRFAVLTFDDGYRDILVRVLPALEAAAAPFTVYVPTAALNGQLDAWWLGLRQVFQQNDRVEIAPMGCAFPAGTRAEKVIGLRSVNAWVTSDFSRAQALRDTFLTYAVDLPGLVRERMLSERELREVASHPLVTIGAHTESHPPLALLSALEATAELSRNKIHLEKLLGRPVDHLAYPYGGPSACGEREATLAAELGFKTAATTRSGTLHEADAKTPFLWPREDVGYPAQSLATLAAHCHGLDALLA